MKPLHLNLKGEYFDAIRDGTKLFEFRVRNAFWCKRLEGQQFSQIQIKRGYPRADDTARNLIRPWRGYEIQTITHPHFGPNPVEVFAIHVAP